MERSLSGDDMVKITYDGRATRTKTTFQLAYGVGIHIRASPERVEALLTDAARFPRWNSTIERIEGEITQGGKIELVSKVAPGRTFRLRVAQIVPGERMVWCDGVAPVFRGVRTFSLRRCVDGTTDFSMVEVFSGLALPMITGSLPDFAPSFEAWARDLKRAAERIEVGRYALAS